MKEDIWNVIPGFPNYEISNNGAVRYLNGKLLRLYPYKGYSLARDGKQWYIRPPRLLYAVIHGISPLELKNIVVLNIDGVLTPMTRTEYADRVNRSRRRGLSGEEEAKKYYLESIRFSRMMLAYYEKRDMAEIVNELSNYKNYVKSYIRKMGFSCNDSIINETWDELYFEILSKIHDGRISIISPKNYLLKCVRIHFKELRKKNRNIVRIEDSELRFCV